MSSTYDPDGSKPPMTINAHDRAPQVHSNRSGYIESTIKRRSSPPSIGHRTASASCKNLCCANAPSPVGQLLSARGSASVAAIA